MKNNNNLILIYTKLHALIGIRRHYAIMSLVLSLFSTTANATFPATIGQLLCHASSVLVGTVQEITISSIPCTMYCSSDFEFTHEAVISVLVDEIVSDKKDPDIGMKPGSKILLKIGSHDLEKLSVNPSKISSFIKGRKFLFSVSIHAYDMSSQDGTITPLPAQNDPYRAQMWPIGERDRAIYLFNGKDISKIDWDEQANFCTIRSNYPCASDKSAKSVDELYTALSAPNASEFTHECYRNALVGKGDAAIPAIVKLLDSDDLDVQKAALSTLWRFGPKLSAALPSLLRILESGNVEHDGMIFDAIYSFGEKAKPAIPLFIKLSLSDNADLDSYTSNAAIGSLAMLGKYEPETVVPHFVRLLKNDINRSAVARGLGHIGAPAQLAIPELKDQIQIAISEKRTELLGDLISAVINIDGIEKATPFFAALLSNTVTVKPTADTLNHFESKANLPVYGGDYKIDPSAKFYMPGERIKTPFKAPKDVEACELYLNNLQYFARRNMPMSCGQSIAPGLDKNIQPVKWEDLDPAKYTELFNEVVAHAGLLPDGAKVATDELARWSQEVRLKRFVFRRAKLELKGHPAFQNNADAPEAAFEIVQYGPNETDATDPESACHRRFTLGRGYSESDTQNFYAVTSDLRHVYISLGDWSGWSAQKLWLINHSLYGERSQDDGNVNLYELLTDPAIHLEPVCLYHFNKTSSKGR